MFVSQLKKVTFDNGGVGGEHQIATDEGVTSEKKHHTRALTHTSERLSEEECDGDVVI
jgi:hypothetical protein